MNIVLITPSRKVEILKQKARRLKKELGLSHHEALNQIAKKFDYHHWHHVTKMQAITEPSEMAYRKGLLVAFDVKEAEDFDEEFFIEDSLSPYFCEKELWENYLEISSVEDDEFHDLPETEQREHFQYFIDDLVFFRYTKKSVPKDIEGTLDFINKHSFWLPMYVWLKGDLYNTYGELVAKI